MDCRPWHGPRPFLGVRWEDLTEEKIAAIPGFRPGAGTLPGLTRSSQKPSSAMHLISQSMLGILSSGAEGGRTKVTTIRRELEEDSDHHGKGEEIALDDSSRWSRP